VCDNTTLNVGSQCPTLNVVFFCGVHAECDVETYDCDYDTHESDYDSYNCQNHTLRVEITPLCDVYTHIVINTRTNVISARKV
jgi:hypothetical protein